MAFIEGNCFEVARVLLGCDLFEHELVNGHFPTILKLEQCTTTDQINEILDSRHKQLKGKSLLWHYDIRKKKRKHWKSKRPKKVYQPIRINPVVLDSFFSKYSLPKR